MDELDLLKKDWLSNQKDFQQRTAKDLYIMLQKKSSSIVKTLFYISIAELVFWICVNTIPLISSESYKEQLNMVYKNDVVFYAITVVSYAIILLFVYLLFKSYKNISVTDNVKKLMQNILKTRKIIKCYVIYNLAVGFIAMIGGSYHGIVNNPEIAEDFNNFNQTQIIVTFCLIAVFTLLFVGLLWLFYKLLYGILLKRLNKNYKELEKLEI